MSANSIGAGFAGGEAGGLDAEKRLVEHGWGGDILGQEGGDGAEAPDAGEEVARRGIGTQFDIEIGFPFQRAGIGIGEGDGDLSAGVDIEGIRGFCDNFSPHEDAEIGDDRGDGGCGIGSGGLDDERSVFEGLRAIMKLLEGVPFGCLHRRGRAARDDVGALDRIVGDAGERFGGRQRVCKNRGEVNFSAAIQRIC